MSDRTKKILEEQLELLHERAKVADDEYLAEISAQMISLAKIIEPELQSRLNEEKLFEEFVSRLSELFQQTAGNFDNAQAVCNEFQKWR